MSEPWWKVEDPNQPGHKAPDVNLSDLPKVPTGPGPGQPAVFVLRSEVEDRFEKLLALHESRESATGASGPWCAEDGRPWPCQTVKILTGEANG